MILAAVKFRRRLLDLLKIFMKGMQNFSELADFIIPVDRQCKVHTLAMCGLHKRVHHVVDGADDAPQHNAKTENTKRQRQQKDKRLHGDCPFGFRDKILGRISVFP